MRADLRKRAGKAAIAQQGKHVGDNKPSVVTNEPKKDELLVNIRR